jgi:hypothetical protein
MRRRSGNYLIWHHYETAANRAKWARIYHVRGDTVWMNEDGSTDDLYFLRDEKAWKP